MKETFVAAYFIAAPALSVALGAAALALGRRRAALRHRVVSVTLAMMALLPLLALSLPGPVRWSLPPGLGPEAPGAESPARPAPAEIAPAPGRRADAASPAVPAEAASPPARPAPRWRPAPSTVSLLDGLLALAAAGAALAGVRHIAAVRALHRLLARAASPPELRAEVERLRRRLGIARPVRAVLSPELSVPVAWGVLRPVIAMPGAAGAWPDRRRRMALLHELAHVRRRDGLALGILRVAQALYWWNPLVAWLAATARGDAEVATDALVVDSGVGVAAYARELVAVLRTAKARRAVIVGSALGAEAGLAERIDALRRSPQPGLVPRRAAWVTLVAAATVTAALGAARPRQAVAAPPPPAPAAGAASEAVATSRAREGDGPMILRALVDALTDPEATVRRSAANALRGASEAAAREALTARLDDPDPHVRRAVETALGLREHVGVGEGFQPTLWSPPVPEPGEVERLTEALVQGSEVERRVAADRLGNLRPAESVPSLVAALRDPSPDVRMRAASALANLGARSAAPAILPLLRDPHEHVRERAAHALGNLGDPVAVESLVALAGDPEEHVRQAAAGGLGGIGSPRGAPALVVLLGDPDEHVRRTAVEALGKLRAAGGR